jgi:hypothetical protein
MPVMLRLRFLLLPVALLLSSCTRAVQQHGFGVQVFAAKSRLVEATGGRRQGDSAAIASMSSLPRGWAAAQ